MGTTPYDRTPIRKDREFDQVLALPILIAERALEQAGNDLKITMGPQLTGKSLEIKSGIGDLGDDLDGISATQ